jgi:hypothetical protein
LPANAARHRIWITSGDLCGNAFQVGLQLADAPDMEHRGTQAHTCGSIKFRTLWLLLHSRLDGTRQAEAQQRNRRATTALEHLEESSRQRLQTQEQLQVRSTIVFEARSCTIAATTAGDKPHERWFLELVQCLVL